MIENAARRGLVVAAFVFAFIALGSVGGVGSVLALASGIAGAVYLIRQQCLREREARSETGRGVPAAALASYGVAIAFFAALPVVLAVYLVLRFLLPGYIVSRLEASVDVMAQIPEYASLAEQMQHVLDHGPIPTPADMMASVLMMMMLTGLFLGITGVIIAKTINRK